MRKKTIIQVDTNTGEALHGTLVWVEDRPRSMEHFVKTYQNGMKQIAKYGLTGETHNVLWYVMSVLSFDNWINVTQTEIGNELGLARQNVARAMKVLVDKQIILEGPKKGRCHTYRLNYAIGYKGDEGRATKGGFRVLDGGKTTPVPTPEIKA